MTYIKAVRGLVWLDKYQKDMYLKKNGLHAQNMTTILDSIVNIIGAREGTYTTI